jgi:hypothetical protein
LGSQIIERSNKEFSAEEREHGWCCRREEKQEFPDWNLKNLWLRVIFFLPLQVDNSFSLLEGKWKKKPGIRKSMPGFLFGS